MGDDLILRVLSAMLKSRAGPSSEPALAQV
jgi:hypothetical protein